MSTITWSKFLVLLTFFANDCLVIFKIFINIHEDANEKIYIEDHRMKKLVKLDHL